RQVRWVWCSCSSSVWAPCWSSPASGGSCAAEVRRSLRRLRGRDGVGGRYTPGVRDPLRLLVLVSGSGSLLQALLNAQAAGTLPARVVAVGADRAGCTG